MFRDGSLSTFNVVTSGLDTFPIVKPFNADGPQPLNSVISSTHFNKLFDAALKMELALQGKIGSPIYSPSPAKLSFQTLTLNASSNLLEVDVTAPVSMGSTPFADPKFSIGHTVQLVPGPGFEQYNYPSYTRDYMYFGPNNWLHVNPQFYLSVVPVSGRVFKLRVANVNYTDFSFNLDGSIRDDLRRASYPSAVETIPVWDIVNPGTTSNTFEVQSTPTNHKLRVYSRTSNNKYGATTMSVAPSNSGYISWAGFTGCEAISTPDSSSKVYSRLGPMVHFTGVASACSFYCLSFGDVTLGTSSATDKRFKARLLRVEGANLLEDDYAVWEAAVTDLSSVIDFNTLIDLHCKLVKTGDEIDVQTSPDGLTWTSLAGFPITDPDPLPGTEVDLTPLPGFFSQYIGGSHRSHLEFNSPIKAQAEDAITHTLKVNLMYLLSGSDTLTTSNI